MIEIERLKEFKGEYEKDIFISENFKILAMRVDRSEDVTFNKYGNVTIKGDLPKLENGIKYKIKAIENTDSYGTSYSIVTINADKPKNQTETYNFLREIISINQASELYKTYPNIVDDVVSDPEFEIDYSKTKGIKKKTFDKIKLKIIENFMFMDIINEYQGMLSLNTLKKLLEKYKTVEKIKREIRKDPYRCMCELNGVGFTTADKTLVTMQQQGYDFGYDIITSSQRCISCINYHLLENEANGNTFLRLADVQSLLRESVPECYDRLMDCLKNEKFVLNRDLLSISRKITFDTEMYIAECVNELLVNSNEGETYKNDSEKYRKLDGIDLTDDQVSIIDIIAKNKISILSGHAGCVDCDTEYFNGKEWKKISEYQDNEMVMQYNPNGYGELVYPNNYYKRKADYLWHFETKYGLDQCLSDNHNVYYITSKGNLYSKTFKEVRENQSGKGFSGKFITTFKKYGEGIKLSNDEIRLMVAVFADGSFVRTNCSDYRYKECRFHLKKKRKKDRLINLINNLELEYRTKKSAADGYDDFYVRTPLRCKHFPSDWYNATKEQFEIIMDEVLYWDSYEKIRNGYSTTRKNDADYIQYVFTVLGHRATISTYDRVGQDYFTCGETYKRKSVEYSVSYNDRTLIKMCYDNRPSHTKTPIEKYKTIDGYEYCFNVPSEMLVLRRNNKIFITGNCGKTQTTKAVINMLEDIGKTYLLLAPTGKASKVMKENTQRNASTIHRGLGYQPPNWSYNKENKLSCDVVIVDEFSMCDIFLFAHLLDAVDLSKTRLLIIGDNAQLPSVSCGNILQDLLVSKKIPTIHLDKVFRYKDGGLMNVATKVRNCEEYLPNNLEKLNFFGDSKDYAFIKSSNDTIMGDLKGIYKKLLTQYKVDEISVLTAYKVGKNGTIAINKELQKLVNKNYGSEVNLKIGENIYYQSDVIIQNKNNYKAQIYTSDIWEDDIPETLIANGETGIIIEVDPYGKYVVIDFDGTKIFYTKEDMLSVSLGYAISIHKSQGSQNKVIILTTASSQIYMLNSNLVYVGLTRTKEKCYHIGEPSVVNKVIHKKANLERDTFLEYFLRK